jgi:hypothetical protein
MFELLRLHGSSGGSIALQTRKGRDIPNELGLELTPQHHSRYDLLLKRAGRNWQLRRSPSGGYNCAGHVWASRRTCVYEVDWKNILDDDGYRRTDHPVADDLVLYVERNYGILHIGRIVEMRQGLTAESSRIAWVVSKWNNWSGEVCHFVLDHPWGDEGFDVTLQFWTDRSEKDLSPK